MKRTLTALIIMSLCIAGAKAQGTDGFFHPEEYSPREGDPSVTIFGYDGVGLYDPYSIIWGFGDGNIDDPGAPLVGFGYGGTINETPLGSGLLLLAGMGLAYSLKRKNKKQIKNNKQIKH